MISTKNKIISQIPNHILRNNPRFVDFLVAYYEWCSQPDNAQYNIKRHTKRLSFEEPLDKYVELMEREYLGSLPKQDTTDIKELLIKLSKKFNASRGSRLSYQFLIKALIGDNDLEFYNPKDDIFSLSESRYVNDEYLVVVDYEGVLPDEQIMNNGEAYLDRYNFVSDVTPGNETIELIFVKPKTTYSIGDTIQIGDNTFNVIQNSEKTQGFYITEKSHLSNNSLLQDSYYYSVYSFVVRTNQQINDYAEYIRNNLAPAGFKLFIE